MCTGFRFRPAAVLACAVTMAWAPGVSVLATAAEDAREKIAIVEHEIGRLKAAGQVKQAADLSERLRPLRERLEGVGAVAGGPGAGPELHVVGMYAGYYPDTSNEYGRAVVEVEVTDRPVVLALCAYHSVRWEVRLGRGVNIQRLVLAGYEDQVLDGPVNAAVVERHTHKAKDRDYFYCYYRGGESFVRAEAVLKKLTGLEICTLLGKYSYKQQPVVVGKRNPEWLGQEVSAELQPLYLGATAYERAKQREAVGHETFEAIHWTGVRGMQAAGSLARFTLAGPLETSMRPRPGRVNRIAVDPRGPTYYGADSHSVFTIDPATGKATEMRIDPALPRLSWASGVAFDTRRNRLLLTGQGCAYWYEPHKARWTVAREVSLARGFGPGPRIASLTYSAADDCFYALAVPTGDYGSAELIRLTADAIVTGSVELSRDIPGESRMMHSTPPQLAAVGNKLAILVGPEQDDSGDAPPGKQMTCLLADPQTGRVTYASQVRPVVEAKGGITPTEVESLWRELAGADVDSAERAVRKLVAGGPDAVSMLRPKLSGGVYDAARAPELVDKLSADAAKDRESATAELERTVAAAAPELRKALARGLPPEGRLRVEHILRRFDAWTSPQASSEAIEKEASDPILRRRLRAIRVLSMIGTPEAVDCLWELATGDKGSIEAQQARAALRRV